MKTGLIFDALDLELNRGKDLLKNGTKKSLIEKLWNSLKKVGANPNVW